MINKALVQRSVQAQFLSYCMDQKPREACGFLLGSIDGATVNAEQFVPIANIAENPETRFLMEPAAMIRIVMQHVSANTYSKSLVGILHSHPTASAIPSSEDLLTAWLHVPTHWIVSLHYEKELDIRAYHYYSHPVRESSGAARKEEIAYASVPIQLVED